MDLKNAVAVCLISLFSATLVVLIARSLDSQAAAQLEPQLIRIAEELTALRKQAGLRVSPDAVSQGDATGGELVVHYFHGNARCVDCQTMEATAKKTVETDFAQPLSRGEVVWKVLNYDTPAGMGLARKFEVKDPVVVIARVKDNEVRDGWKRLDGARALVSDPSALAEYLRGEIRQMLDAAKSEAAAAKPQPGASAPPASAPSDVIVKPAAELPLPK